MEQENDKKTKGQSFWELAKFAIIAVLIVIPIRIFVAQPFIVSGSSMVPTFENGQYLIVDELSYHLGSPKRDDVVVFRYPNDTTKFFIKRIIGLPGETVDIKNGTVTITNAEHPDGLTLNEPYIDGKQTGGVTHMVLNNDQYFVMGDNRPASSDSRYWGPVPRNLLIGRVLLRLLPVGNIGFMPGEYKQSA